MDMNLETIHSDLMSDDEDVSEAANDLAESLFDAKLLAVVRAEFPAGYFTSHGACIQCMHQQVTTMMRRYAISKEFGAATDVKLLALFRAEFPTGYFASRGSAMLSLLQHVELMVERYAANTAAPSMQQRAALARLDECTGQVDVV